MGATSVTGISGPGTAAGKQRGSEHMSLGVEKLIGLRPFAAGTATLTGSTFAVVLPTLPGVASDYSVHVTASNSTAVFVTSLTTGGFTINGASGQTVYWVVMKNGIAY